MFQSLVAGRMISDSLYHIYIPKITQKYNQSQINQHNRKSVREVA